MRSYWLVVLEVYAKPRLDNEQKLRLRVLMNASFDNRVCQGYCLRVWHAYQQILIKSGLA